MKLWFLVRLYTSTLCESSKYKQILDLVNVPFQIALAVSFLLLLAFFLFFFQAIQTMIQDLRQIAFDTEPDTTPNMKRQSQLRDFKKLGFQVGLSCLLMSELYVNKTI